MSHLLIQADARRIPLANESVHAVITSPPYFGLRDYGTATWAGGDPDCDHNAPPAGGWQGKVERGGADPYERGGNKGQQYPHVCGKCGARRVDAQIGLEATPEAYVASMVAVFAEVRRVLRPDGTCWLNLGSSYASGDTVANRSPLVSRVPACGTDGIRQRDSEETDSSCLDRDGEHRDDSQSHRGRIPGNDQSLGTSSPLPEKKDRGIEPLDLVASDASALDDLQSTNPSSSDYAQDAFAPVVRVSELQKEHQTSSGDGLLFEDTEVCTSGTSETLDSSAVDKKDKDVLGSACGDPECKGSCGICYAYYTIPFLKFKSKDMIMMPHLLAMALQADGWYVRMDICWVKPNPMPESVTDRPTKSHEYLFLLTKQERYYFDQEAVREKSTEDHAKRGRIRPSGNAHFASDPVRGASKSGLHHVSPSPSRNLRSVWSIPTESYAGAHFATFPRKLVEPCIKAGTSERGACPTCGAPWERVIDSVKYQPEIVATGERFVDASRGDKVRKLNGKSPEWVKAAASRSTLGWRPTCSCPTAEPVPCVVLDPFAGSGTTLVVAEALGRVGIGLDLSGDYLAQAKRRIERPHQPLTKQREQTMPLFAHMEDA